MGGCPDRERKASHSPLQNAGMLKKSSRKCGCKTQTNMEIRKNDLEYNTNTRLFARKKKTKTPAYTFKKGNCAKEKRKKRKSPMFGKKTSLFVIFSISTCLKKKTGLQESFQKRKKLHA